MDLIFLRQRVIEMTLQEFSNYPITFNERDLEIHLAPEIIKIQEADREFELMKRQGRTDEIRSEAIRCSKELFKVIPSKLEMFAYGFKDKSALREILMWCDLSFWKLFYDEVLINLLGEIGRGISNEPPLFFTQPELALYLYYTGKIISNKKEAEPIAKEYGHESGNRLYILFNKYTKRVNRVGADTQKKATNQANLIKKVIPHLSGPQKATAESELKTLEARISKNES